jgi:hypothetical protein
MPAHTSRPKTRDAVFGLRRRLWGELPICPRTVGIVLFWSGIRCLLKRRFCDILTDEQDARFGAGTLPGPMAQ